MEQRFREGVGVAAEAEGAGLGSASRNEAIANGGHVAAILRLAVD